MKITERMSWEELARWYQSEHGETVHPQTLRRALIRDGVILMTNERASRQVQLAMDTIWDKVDILRLITYAFNGKFTEWSMIYEKVMQTYVDDEASVTIEEITRMDGLWNDLTSFFMRALSLMRELKGGGGSIPELEILIRSTGAVAGVESGGSDNKVEMSSILEEVSRKTKAMLEGVHEHHKEEGHGFYRMIDEEEEDLLEVDK